MVKNINGSFPNIVQKKKKEKKKKKTKKNTSLALITVGYREKVMIETIKCVNVQKNVAQGKRAIIWK